MSGARNIKDEFNASDIEDLIAPSGGTDHGQISLDGTWNAIPASSPTKSYVLSISKETVSGVVRWSYNNDDGPSSSLGNRLHSSEIAIPITAGQTVYVTSDNDGDTLNFTYIEVN